MSTHDFRRLSPYDFEELVGDLLEMSLGTRIQRFSRGRDKGIDLRATSPDGKTIIIQCKHRPDIAFTTLESALKKEVPKVQALAPGRYILCVSTNLSPPNKDTLVELFHPYVKTADDILGPDDLNALLRRFPKVEVSNFKLWFTSADVVERVLHNAEHNRSEFKVREVAERMRLFVQSQAYPAASRILEKERFCIISGAPGVGKTTLADMLLFAHLEQDYQPVVIESSIQEAQRQFKPDRPQIFYFDDFLGETFLDDRGQAGGINSDAALLRFIEGVKKTEKSRFLMTTREHILRKALLDSERLRHSDLIDAKCILEVSHYRLHQKARILHNHIHFSNLSDEYRRALLDDEFYLEIVKHENFSPRIVEWLSGYKRIAEIAPQNFAQYVKDLLRSPAEIWEHAFERQLTKSAQSLLLLLVSLAGHGRMDHLEDPFRTLNQHRSRTYNYQTRPNSFRDALHELEGVFISIGDGSVSFLNPSIRDFMQDKVRDEGEHANDLMAAAVRFRQVQTIQTLAREFPGSALARATGWKSPIVMNAIDRTLSSAFVKTARTVKWGHSRLIYFDSAPEHRFRTLVAAAEETQSAPYFAFASRAFELFQSQLSRFSEIGDLVEMATALEKAPWVLQSSGEPMLRQLLQQIVEAVPYANLEGWSYVLEYEESSGHFTKEDRAALMTAFEEFSEDGALEEVREAARSELAEVEEAFSTFERRFGLTLERAKESIRRRIEEALFEDHTDDEEEFEPAVESASADLEGLHTRFQEATVVVDTVELDSDAELHHMFNSLRD